MAPDHLGISVLTWRLMVTFLSLVSILAVAAYLSRLVGTAKRASRYVESVCMGSIIGAAIGFFVLLSLWATSRIEVEDEHVWRIVAFVAGGGFTGACVAVGITFWRDLNTHYRLAQTGAEPGASPNVGSGKPLGNSGVTDEPPFVS